jgi:hypothetical protein
MKLPRDLSGGELVEVLCRHFDYRSINLLDMLLWG